MILQDLTFLNGNTTAFANALIANAPVSFNSYLQILVFCGSDYLFNFKADLVAQDTTLRDSILAAFVPAIAAYSS